MTKTLRLFGALVCAALILGISSGKVFARLTGSAPTNADVWCVGPSGAEVCADASGNFLPTTDNDVTLGTSALQWATAYFVNLTVSGNSAVTGNSTVTGDLTVTSDILKTPVASAVLGAGGTIGVAGACGGVVQLNVNADVTTDTTNTFTAPSTANTGCRVDVINLGGGTITLDDNALFNVAANIILSTGDSAQVVSTGAAWLLIGTSDN